MKLSDLYSDGSIPEIGDVVIIDKDLIKESSIEEFFLEIFLPYEHHIELVNLELNVLELDTEAFGDIYYDERWVRINSATSTVDVFVPVTVLKLIRRGHGEA